MADAGTYLVGYLERVGDPYGPNRIALHRSPFRIGRSPEAELTVYSREVSTLHAEIVRVGASYLVRDLGSTNGTFVNGERIEKRVLVAGDIVHVASEEMRFGLAPVQEFDPQEPTLAGSETRQQQLIRESNDLGRILAHRAVGAVFQPIVWLAHQHSVFGYETLGRVALPGCVYSVGDVLRIAVARGEGARLTRMMREIALAELGKLPPGPCSIFFNLHVTEMVALDRLDELLGDIAAALGPEQRAVLEIHEAAVTDPRAMRSIRERLDAHRIGLAYDDFGAGQSRLMELIDVPPDFLKLDMALVRDVDRSPKRQELVRALVTVMKDLGIRVLAEGVEREEEAVVCRDLGCELGQGYLFGRPVIATALG